MSWAELDGQWVVFQRANGLVCELDGLSALVLSILELAAVRLDDLVDHVAHAACAGGAAVAPAQVGAAVQALIAAGLVEQLHRLPQPCA
ncbi:MAG: hypothetical protein QE285_04295 [Aquabacterium sp.]|nr:hypothetical protein [Aquabacterium sp.]